ncbi:MAG: hypothetical protein GY810_25450 [Aureispira sp.]|nr:hypothetical protein [Aureispira sp.]
MIGYRFMLSLCVLSLLTGCFKKQKHFTTDDIVGEYSIHCGETGGISYNSNYVATGSQSIGYETILNITYSANDPNSNSLEVSFDPSQSIPKSEIWWSIADYNVVEEYSFGLVYGSRIRNLSGSGALVLNPTTSDPSDYEYNSTISWVFKLNYDKVSMETDIRTRKDLNDTTYTYACECFGEKK